MAGSRSRRPKPAAADGEEPPRVESSSPDAAERFSGGSTGAVERQQLLRFEAPRGRESRVHEVEGFDEAVRAAHRERAGAAHPPASTDRPERPQ